MTQLAGLLPESHTRALSALKTGTMFRDLILFIDKAPLSTVRRRSFPADDFKSLMKQHETASTRKL